MSELTILAAVALGLGIPLARSLATSAADRRRTPEERFESACRELSLAPVHSPEETDLRWRGRALGVDVDVVRRVVDGLEEIELTAPIVPPLDLGLVLVSDGELPPLDADVVVEEIDLDPRGRPRARATDALRARRLAVRLARRVAPLGDAFLATIADASIKLSPRAPFVRDDLARMAAAAAEILGDLRERNVEAKHDVTPAWWSRFAERRGLKVEAGPTLSGILGQVPFEAALDHDTATGALAADLVLRGEIAEGRVFSLVARDHEPRTSAPDVGGSTGDADLDRRFCLLVSNASGRASLEDARVRRVIAGLPPSVRSVHLASLGLRLGVAHVAHGDDLEELVRLGDALVRAATGRGGDERPVYR